MGAETAEPSRIPESTVRRLSTYYRILAELAEEGQRTVSSFGLAERAGVTPAQVRKDFSVFGHFGKRGTGYPVDPLHREIRSILGLDRRWKVGLAGAGNLAHALYAYPRFGREGFDIRALFDNDPRKIGETWNGLTVLDVADLALTVREMGLDLGLVTTPAAAAQEVTDRFVEGGVRGILNFAPRKLQVPPGVELRNVNLAIELETLSFALK